MPGDSLKLRARIEGNEIPCVSCYVNASVNTGPAAATVQIVALTSAMHMPPNALIEVYFLDTSSLRSTALDAPSQEPFYSTKQQTGQYRHLFSGKVVGFSYRRAGSEKAVILQCLDASVQWQTVTNMTGGKAAAIVASDEFADAITLGAAQKAWVSKLQTIMDEGASGITVARDFTSIDGALGALINLLLAAGGVFPPATSDGIEARRGDNLWSTYEELRMHLSMQIGTDDGVSATTVYSWDKLKKSLFSGGGGIAGSKQSISFYEIAQHICQQIFYNMSPQPCPQYVPYKGEDGWEKISYPNTTSFDIGLAPIYTQLQDFNTKLSAVLRNWQAQDAILGLMGDSAANLASSTKGAGLDYGLLAMRNFYNTVGGMLSYLKGFGDTSKPTASDSIAAKLSEIKNDIAVAVAEFSQPGMVSAGKVEDSNEDAYKAIPNLYWEVFRIRMRDVQVKVAALLAGAGEYKNAAVTVNSKGRLLTQIIMPDIWMCAPPVCNVIFQDEYEAFDMGRNFLEEATKVIVTVGSESGGKGDEFLSAITLGDSGGKDTELTVGNIQSWERFSGPIIKRIAIPSMFAIKGEGAKDYGKKVADYLFYHLRFMSRTAQVRTKFLPRLALGAPCAVLLARLPSSWSEASTAKDAPNYIDTVAAAIQAMADRGLRPPSQVLGMLSGLSHQCSQSTASTTVEINHARASHPDDDFLLSNAEPQAATETPAEAKVLVTTQLLYEDAIAEWRTGYSDKLDMLRAASPPAVTETLRQAYAMPYVSSLFDTLGDSLELQNTALSTRADYNTSGKEDWGTLYAALAGSEAGESLGTLLTGLMTPTLYSASADAQVISFLQTMGDAESFVDSTKKALPVVKGWSLLNVPSNLVKGPTGAAVKYVIAQGELPEIVPDPTDPTIYLFRRLTIVEQAQLMPLNTTDEKKVEEKLMPSWIKDSYSNDKITDVYYRLFGCKAITDPTVIGGDVASTKTGVAGTQEAAVDALAFYYDRMKRISDAATLEFIDSYTYRPIATMNDCVGFNTYLDPNDGLFKAPAVGQGAQSETTVTENKEKGSIVGFYQGSTGRGYSELKGMLGGDASLLSAPLAAFHKTSDKVQLEVKLDTRDERAQRVEYMIRELRSFSGGIID